MLNIKHDWFSTYCLPLLYLHRVVSWDKLKVGKIMFKANILWHEILSDVETVLTIYYVKKLISVVGYVNSVSKLWIILCSFFIFIKCDN